MAEYIDREAFLAAKRKVYCDDCNSRKNSKGKMVYDIGDAPCRACGVGDVLDDVEDFPAADVVERKRGKWELFNNSGLGFSHSCSLCNFEVREQWIDFYNFCPNCGADMREESW